MMMAAAAAAAAGVCLAADTPVETPKVLSSNIVGYQKMSLTEGALTPAVSTFIPVGDAATNATLGDIAVNEAWDPTGDSVQIWDKDGATAATYTYISAARVSSFSGCPGPGWYDADVLFEDREYEDVSDTKLPAGAGIVAQASQSGRELVFKGEVSRETVALPLTARALTVTGNTAPADLTLGDIQVNAAWDPIAGDSVQILDGFGATSKTYTYISADRVSSFSGCPGPGWYDAEVLFEDREYENVSDFPLPAGAGIVAQASQSGRELTLPKAEIAPEE